MARCDKEKLDTVAAAAGSGVQQSASSLQSGGGDHEIPKNGREMARIVPAFGTISPSLLRALPSLGRARTTPESVGKSAIVIVRIIMAQRMTRTVKKNGPSHHIRADARAQAPGVQW